MEVEAEVVKDWLGMGGCGGGGGGEDQGSAV